MSFYLKKSLRFGPLRFNLSKSGIGVSTGVKGFRIGTGPRGNYIHAGRGGIYYRQTLGGHARSKPTPAVPPIRIFNSSQVSTEFLTSVDSKKLVSDLNKRRKRLPTLPFAILVSSAGTAFAISNSVSPMILAAVAICAAWLCGASAIWDRDRKTAILFYDIETEVLAAFESLHSAFEQAQKCSRVSHIDSTEYYSDRKYHAGVLQGISRSNGRPIEKHPPFVKTNVSIFALPAGKLTLYFCPDRILVYGFQDIYAVAYSDLRMLVENCRFVENEGIGQDQQIVDTTWQYVNKSGGPDRRFSPNPQIPIVIYDQLRIKSTTGLDETFQFSKIGIVVELRDAIRSLGRVLVLTKFWSELDTQDSSGIDSSMWCQYPDANDLFFKIASVRTIPFMEKFRELREAGVSPASPRGCELIVESLIGTILLDWKGFMNQGAALPFTNHNAHELLAQSVELLAFVTNKAVELAKPLSQERSVIATDTAAGAAQSSSVIGIAAQDITVEDEELVEKCIEIIRQEKRASTSLLQRRLRLGYTRAARIVDILEQRGILGPGEGAKPREILVDLDAAV